MSAAVAESFSRAAERYDEHADVQVAMAAWLAEWLPAERSGRALEVGAGTGGFTRHLAGWNGPLVATDLAPAMCVAGAAHVPEFAWRAMDAASPFAGPWEWVFSSSMLQWAESPERVFAAWRDVLVPGGRVLAGLFAAESLPELNAELGAAAPLTWRAPNEWTDALARAGLRVRRAEAERREFRHGSAHALLRSLHGVGAAPGRKIAPAALRRLLAAYDARHGGPDGVRAAWTFFRFEAERG